MIANKNRIFLALNAIGLAGFLYGSSLLWAPPGQEGLTGGPGDPLIWVLSVFPFLALASVINLVWAAIWLARYRRSGRTLLLWLATACLWLLALGYDHHRSYNGKELAPAMSQQEPAMSR